GAGGGDQVLVVHGLDQRFTGPVVDFQQNVGVVLGANQLPDRLPFLHGQRFEDEGDVCRMQMIDDRLDFVFVLPVQQPFQQVRAVVVFVLAVCQRFDDLLPLQ